MEQTLVVAKAFYDLFLEKHNATMDQMRMHKLMYFAQRESLMYNKEPLFAGEFVGWKYGPVLLEVRSEYLKERPFSDVMDKVCDATMKLVKAVCERYDNVSSWKLSTLSHGEVSWKRSRRGLESDENGSVKLKLNDMKVDAARELAKRKKYESMENN